MMHPAIDLHIDRLVLHGFDHVDRTALGAAVEAELARLFAEQGDATIPQNDRHAPRLDGGSFQATPGASAETLGIQIARSVYGGLRP